MLCWDGESRRRQSVAEIPGVARKLLQVASSNTLKATNNIQGNNCGAEQEEQ